MKLPDLDPDQLYPLSKAAAFFREALGTHFTRDWFTGRYRAGLLPLSKVGGRWFVLGRHLLDQIPEPSLPPGANPLPPTREELDKQWRERQEANIRELARHGLKVGGAGPESING